MKKIGKWTVLEEKDVSPSKWFPVHKHKVQLANGTVIDDFYITKLGDAAMIIPVTESGQIVFVRQYRHGAGELTIEFPAGIVEKDLTPDKTAVKELQEETGFYTTIDRLVPLGILAVASSKSSQRIYGFIARNVELKGEQNLDDNEDIEVLLIPANHIKGKILSGEIVAVETVAVLMLAILKHPEIFES